MPEFLLPLILFLLPLAYSPGPGNLFFAANGARFGLRATLPANLGYHLATWVVTLALGLGFAALLTSLPRLLILMKGAGSAYVLYLAWGFFRAGKTDTKREARPASLIDGMVLLILNPKAYLIIALMFSQFLPEGGGAQVSAVIWITSIFTLNNLLAFLIWTLLGDRIAARFRNAAQASWLNRGSALTLALVALWMFFV